MCLPSARLPILLCLLMTASCGGSDNGPAEQPVCTPDCKGRECGDDGCGGTCTPGCDDGFECTKDTCVKGKCSHSLDQIYCMLLETCVPSGTIRPENPCEHCSPADTQYSWSPLEDGSPCGALKVCVAGGCCEPAVACEGKECGDDGCGGQCGTCPEHFQCGQDGKCEPIPCTPECEGKECGDDGCWGTCGECTGAQESCVEGLCECAPACEGKECGNDGCGGKCGQCQGFNVICDEVGLCVCAGPKCGEGCCGASQVCMDDLTCCQPECGDGAECGEDGCGGVCGLCEGGPWVVCVLGQCVCKGTVCPKACCSQDEICDKQGSCCTAQCQGKQCGDNGCGGVCGLCPAGGMCLDGKCPPPGKTCNDGNTAPWDGCTDGELTEFNVNTWTDNWQEAPVVSSFDDGGYVVVWKSKEQDGDLHGIYAQRYKADGKAAGSEFKVNVETEDEQENPAVDTFPDGRFVIVWESWGQDGNGDGVFGQMFKADGSKSGSEFQANTTTLSDQRNPAVATYWNGEGGSPDGGFIVVWDGTNLQDDPNGIYAQAFDDKGSKIGEELRVNEQLTGEQKLPSVDCGDNGSCVIAWQSEMQDTSGSGIVARVYESPVFDSGFSPHTAEFLVNEYVQGNQQEPVVAVQEYTGSEFWVGWISAEQDTSGYGVMAVLVDGAGEILGSESLLNEMTAGDQRDLALATSGEDGSVAAVWASKEQDGSDYGVFARYFDFDLDPIGSEFQVNTFSESIQRSPGVASLPGPAWVMVWHGWLQAGDGYDIYAARFDASGAMLYH